MARNIVYIQANEKIAASFRETFAERGVELTVAKSAGEALEIMGRQEVGLLLVDINIPDMRLSKLVEICSRDYPAVVLNVCVDVYNSLLVTKLVNRHAIHKIFVAPWDIREMVEEIEESLDAAEISREQVLHEKKILKENEQLQNTLESLKSALKKQQFSYGKIRSVTDLFFEHMAEFAGDEDKETERTQLRQIFDTYLRMQTADADPSDHFEETLRSDFDKLTQGRSGFTLSEAGVSMPEGVSKVTAVNIRFAIRMIVYKTVCCAGSGSEGAYDFSVSSEQGVGDDAVFIVTVKGNTQKKSPFLEQTLLNILHLLADPAEISEGDNETVYRLTIIPGARSDQA
ncbi:MAG: hypothetical protein IJU25_07090 [Lachnospiraceae bacterium]|nr:hypothetical protein [Lachnospiraceae bacterium]